SDRASAGRFTIDCAGKRHRRRRRLPQTQLRARATLPELSVEGPGELALAPLGSSPPPPGLSTAVAHRRWLLGWAGRVAEFGFVQCLVQLLAGVAGILVVRTMAK